MICLAAAGAATFLSASAFTLSWTHSVEKTRWEERWEVRNGRLVLTEGRVEGSGAGMEVPDGAALEDGAYRYRPSLPPLEELVLAASGATGGGWLLCPEGGTCLPLGAESGEPIRIALCPAPKDEASPAGTAE